MTKLGNNYPNGHQFPQVTKLDPNRIRSPKREIIIQMVINYPNGPIKIQMGFDNPKRHQITPKDQLKSKWDLMTQIGNNSPNGHQLPKNGQKRSKWDFITQMFINYHKGPNKIRIGFDDPN